MKDPSKNIRKAFYTAINSIPLTVVDEITDNETLTSYVILSTQTEADISTKTKFDSDCTILVDVCSRQLNTLTKDTVDDMADQIVNAIKPNGNSTLSDSLSEFQFLNIKRLSSNTLTQTTPTGYLIRKLLRFSLRAVEL